MQFLNAHEAFELKNGNIAMSMKSNKPTWMIVNPEGDTVVGPIDGQLDYYSRYVIDNFGVITVHIASPESGEASYSEWVTLYDENGKRLLPGYYYTIQPFDGRYLVWDDTSMGLLNESGYWALKVPLYDYLKD